MNLEPGELERSLALALARGQKVRIRLTGRSMWPWLREGDWATIGPCAPRPRLGQVVVFPLHGRLAAHRVVWLSRDGRRLRCKGDALTRPDPPLETQALIGQVCRLETRQAWRAGLHDSLPLAWLSWLSPPAYWLLKRGLFWKRRKGPGSA